MEIVLNGMPRTLQDSCRVSRLLEELGVERNQVAVELNHRILQREEFDGTELREGDRVEIVRFVGGG